MSTAYRPDLSAPRKRFPHAPAIVLLATTMLAFMASPILAANGSAAAAAYDAGKGRQIAYCAVRLTDGAVIASRSATTPLRPASVQKICTAATALTTLGADFQFRTRVATYKDDLLVIGDGDPTLGDPVLADATGQTIYHAMDAWVTALHSGGTASIEGDIILDDNIFRERRHPDWPSKQAQRWYCAPVSGLNFNNNCLDVSLSITDAGIAATIEPASGQIHVVNKLRHGSKQLWNLAYSDDDAVVTLTGKARRSTTSPLSVAVNHPTLLAGRVLAERLNVGGVRFDGRILRRQIVAPGQTLPTGPTVIAEHVTPLATVLARANKRSLNMVAECLLLRSAVAAGRGGTFVDGAKLATEVLTDRFGVKAEEILVADGSGMSRRNRLSPAGAVSILRNLAIGDRGQARAFMASLPASGVDGTLAKRLKAYPGRVVAKTGTLTGTATLAGYLLDTDYQPVIAMAVFCNHTRGTNHEARAVIDALVADWLGTLDR